MNKIQITDKYWITSDSRCWMISEYKGKRIDKRTEMEHDCWVNCSYHGTVQQAIDSLGQRMLREAVRTDISGLREEARQIEAILKRASEAATDGLESNIRRS